MKTIVKNWMRQAPTGERFFNSLLDYCKKEKDIAENNSLEVKGSGVNPTSKVGGAKIAKFILGASNRNPEEIGDVFAGHAIMIIGLDYEVEIGTPVVEVMEINKYVEPFIGSDGPLWDVAWKRLDLNPELGILFIVVDPPKFGTPPYYCRKNGEDLKDGAIYVRAKGETRLANSGDMAMLYNRASVHSVPELTIDVTITGVLVEDINFYNRLLKKYLDLKCEELLNKIPKKSSIRLYTPSVYGESRTVDAYKNDIDNWKSGITRNIDKYTLPFIASLIPSVAIKIKNLSEAYFENIAIDFDFPLSERILIVDQIGENEFDFDDIELALPRAPRAWGVPYASEVIRNFHSINIGRTNEPILSQYKDSIYRFTNDEIRPKDDELYGDLELVLLSFSVDELPNSVKWRATVKNHDALYEGKASLQWVLDNELFEKLSIPLIQ